MNKVFITTLSFLLLFCSELKAQQYENTWHLGGSGNVSIDAITTDTSGNIYTVGRFSDTVDFDFGPSTATLIASNSMDLFINKIDSNGNFIWVKQIEGSVFPVSKGINIDQAGDLIVIGSFFDTVDFNPGAPVNNLIARGSSIFRSDGFVLKLDAQGDFIWAKHFGGPQNDRIVSIVTDDSNNLYFTGFFRDTVDFDPSTNTYNLHAPSNFNATFITKLDQNGNFMWAKLFGGTRYCMPSDITIDRNSNIILCGGFEGTIDFDPGPSTFNLTKNISRAGVTFIAKLDNNGDFIWAKKIDGGNGVGPSSIVVDHRSNIYVSGNFIGTIDFNPGAASDSLYNSIIDSDIFILKLDSLGSYIRAVNFNGPNSAFSNQLTFDQSGFLYHIGTFYDTINLNPNSAFPIGVSEGLEDVMVASLDQNLNYRSGFTVGSNRQEDGTGIVTSLNNKVYAVGQFAAAVDFDFGTSVDLLTPVGTNDGFISVFTQCNVDTSVTILGNTLISNQADLNTAISYQWLDCSNGFAVLPNDTNQQFTPSQNGQYAVEVFNGSCRDTSACISVTSVGLSEKQYKTSLIVYPNPTSEIININFKEKLQSITVYNIHGQKVQEIDPKKNSWSLPNKKGIYLIRLEDHEGNFSFEKVIRN